MRRPTEEYGVAAAEAAEVEVAVREAGIVDEECRWLVGWEVVNWVDGDLGIPLAPYIPFSGNRFKSITGLSEYP